MRIASKHVCSFEYYRGILVFFAVNLQRNWWCGVVNHGFVILMLSVSDACTNFHMYPHDLSLFKSVIAFVTTKFIVSFQGSDVLRFKIYHRLLLRDHYVAMYADFPWFNFDLLQYFKQTNLTKNIHSYNCPYKYNKHWL